MATVTITADSIETSDFTGKSKINLTELTPLKQIEYFYVKNENKRAFDNPKNET